MYSTVPLSPEAEATVLFTREVVVVEACLAIPRFGTYIRFAIEFLVKSPMIRGDDFDLIHFSFAKSFSRRPQVTTLSSSPYVRCWLVQRCLRFRCSFLLNAILSRAVIIFALLPAAGTSSIMAHRSNASSIFFFATSSLSPSLIRLLRVARRGVFAQAAFISGVWKS